MLIDFTPELIVQNIVVFLFVEINLKLLMLGYLSFMVLVRVATLGCIQLAWLSLTFRIKLILPYETASARSWQLKVFLKCIMRLI